MLVALEVGVWRLKAWWIGRGECSLARYET